VRLKLTKVQVKGSLSGAVVVSFDRCSLTSSEVMCVGFYQ
jgi:hypothetical protein